MKIKLATVLTVIGMLFGGWLYIDNDKADAGEFKEFKQRAECRWLGDSAELAQRAIWLIEDRFGKDAHKTELHRMASIKLKRIETKLEKCYGTQGINR